MFGAPLVSSQHMPILSSVPVWFHVFMFCYDLMAAFPLFDQTAAAAGVLRLRLAAATLRPRVSCSCRLAAEEAGAAGSRELIKIHRADAYRT